MRRAGAGSDRAATLVSATIDRQSMMSFQAAAAVNVTIAVASTTIAAPPSAPPIDCDAFRSARGACSRPARSMRAGGRLRLGRFGAVQPIEDRQRLVRRRAAFDRRLQQPPSFVALAALERGHAVLQQLLGLPLPLGLRAARAVDVGARPRHGCDRETARESRR